MAKTGRKTKAELKALAERRSRKLTPKEERAFGVLFWGEPKDITPKQVAISVARMMPAR